MTCFAKTAAETSKAKITTSKVSKPSKPAADANARPESKRTTHKAAEQRRRDSLKAGFDELRLLLPPINTEALDPETGEPLPGSSAPRLLPKSSRVPDDNPNKGVSKVALLKFSNEYIERMQGKIERRNNYIDLLKEAVRTIRVQAGMSPDPHLDELLKYAFEDEDEAEDPASSQSSHKPFKKAWIEDGDVYDTGDQQRMTVDDGLTKSVATSNTNRPSRAASTRSKRNSTASTTHNSSSSASSAVAKTSSNSQCNSNTTPKQSLLNDVNPIEIATVKDKVQQGGDSGGLDIEMI